MRQVLIEINRYYGRDYKIKGNKTPLLTWIEPRDEFREEDKDYLK